ncbi:Radical SAM domain protein [Ignisphaera aggregans DSM 17230]|uniref:Radical SAM domain protein n=1 Tax=Ignisphaera aggregans (strain DSM 17230 / JCM 13409 / AQ1.S1) TaxID=583356 RepID=E0STP3_IGNAA|nr:Radical SAM domain protein [Ignisphaera aggregans DSM 17230]
MYNKIPNIVLWYATERCDVGCKHCCYPPINRRELDTDEAKFLISKLGEWGVKYFVFIGGEPFLRDDILELVKWCTKLKIKPYIVTKGGRLAKGDDNAEKLAMELKRADAKVTVAIDGITHATIDAICGLPEVYDRIMNTINLCLKYEILQGFVTAALKPNINEIISVLDLASELGLERCVIFGIRPIGRGKTTFNLFAPTPKEFNDFMMRIALGIKEKRWRQEVYIYDPLFLRVVEEMKVSNYDCSKVCKIGLYFNIDSEGYAMPCLFAPLRFKNVLNESLDEVYLDMIEKTKHLRNPEALRGKCGVCKYKYICGGCRVRAYELTGDWLASDPLCPYASEDETYIKDYT